MSLPAETLRLRPDVQAQEFAVTRQAYELKLARNQRLPSFNLSGSLTGQSSDLDNLFDAEQIVRSLAARLNYTLFDSGVLKTNEQSAELSLRQALANYQTTLLTAQQEVEDALTELAVNLQQQSAFQQAEASATLAEQLAGFEYESGLLDFSDRLQTQAELLSAQLALTENRGQILQAWVQLYRSLGGGWQDLTSSD